MNRREFLRIALPTAIATPIIAKAIMIPDFSVPGFSFVDEISRADLDSRVRFANAIYTPGNFDYAHRELYSRASAVLPPGTWIDVRAVPFSAPRMKQTQCGLKRDGYAVLWLTGTDSLKEDRFIRLGRHELGNEREDEWLFECEYHPSYEEYCITGPPAGLSQFGRSGYRSF